MSDLFNPANGRRITALKTHSAGDVKTGVERARAAQPGWADIPFSEKKRVMRRVAGAIEARADELALLIASCTGKTRIDALSTEVLPAAIAVRYYVKISRRFLKPKKQKRSSILFFNKTAVLHRVPYGTVGIISPWNYPFGIPFHEVAQALIAGNAVVLKVATQAQPVGEELVRLFHDAGVPREVLRLVHVRGSEAGGAFIDAGVDKLFFTGSVAVGRELMRLASKTLTPVGLELGGNDAMLVLADANLKRAAAGAVWAGISNCGQSCGGVERIYVEDAVYDDFLALLREEIERLRQGDDTSVAGTPPAGDGFHCDFGSLTTESQFDTVKEQVAESLVKGAMLSAQSTPVAEEGAAGLFAQAMVIENVDHSMALMREETFGPVLGIMRVENREEALRLANDSDLGLSASVWSGRKKTAAETAGRIEAGAVTVNDHLMSHGMPETPWGGYKNSSIGRTHGIPGFEEMTQPKVVVYDSLPWVNRNIWWYPYSAEVYDGLRGALSFVASRNIGKKLRGALKVGRLYISRLFS